MEASSKVLCQAGSAEQTDWVELYERSFPVNERMPVDTITRHLREGKVLLHRTLDRSGSLVCFSLVLKLSNFLFLQYIATDKNSRSKGYGSQHLERLVKILQSGHPGYLGLFFEIQSSEDKSLSQATLRWRKRRRAFYERLGARRMRERKYLYPSMVKGEQPLEGELLWFQFSQAPLSDVVLRDLLAEIYITGYKLDRTDPLVETVLSQFPAPSRQMNDENGSPANSTGSSSPCHCRKCPVIQLLQSVISFLKRFLGI